MDRVRKEAIEIIDEAQLFIAEEIAKLTYNPVFCKIMENNQFNKLVIEELYRHNKNSIHVADCPDLYEGSPHKETVKLYISLSAYKCDVFYNKKESKEYIAKIIVGIFVSFILYFIR